MRLRKGENNQYLEEDYLQIELKEILDKQTINKKIMYSVEWKDGRKEWVPQKKIQHECEKLNDFESLWWRNKRKYEKEGILNNSYNDQVNNEDISYNGICNDGNKVIEEFLQEKNCEEINKQDLTSNCINNNINMNKDIETLCPTNIQIENPDTRFEDQSSIDKAIDNSPFEIKKINKSDSSQTVKKNSRKKSKSIHSNTEHKMVKNKNPNMNIEKVLLGNKREKPLEEVQEMELTKNDRENVQVKKNEEEEIPKINYPEINILECDDIEETEYLVQWKKREDGTIPNFSFISEKEAQSKFSNLLCDFLSKTLKDSEMKKLEFPI